jgi:hypothetical protein
MGEDSISQHDISAASVFQRRRRLFQGVAHHLANITFALISNLISVVRQRWQVCLLDNIKAHRKCQLEWKTSTAMVCNCFLTIRSFHYFRLTQQDLRLSSSHTGILLPGGILSMILLQMSFL